MARDHWGVFKVEQDGWNVPEKGIKKRKDLMRGGNTVVLKSGEKV